MQSAVSRLKASPHKRSRIKLIIALLLLGGGCYILGFALGQISVYEKLMEEEAYQIDPDVERIPDHWFDEAPLEGVYEI